MVASWSSRDIGRERVTGGGAVVSARDWKLADLAARSAAGPHAVYVECGSRLNKGLALTLGFFLKLPGGLRSDEIDSGSRIEQQ